MGKKSLFDDEDAKEVKLKVNEKFAKRFEVRAGQLPLPPPAVTCTGLLQGLGYLIELPAHGKTLPFVCPAAQPSAR